ncbi:hypothetical protein GY24_06280 [Microterricola pindariensis]|uniref:Uncharacterized protein n=1 Tax=Microterricola pindariensis TaxID=478010 RepID=A0ABX5AX57_9MICO|nr:hypothetical protein GY24_06280 [Microterricola pindariensis]
MQHGCAEHGEEDAPAHGTRTEIRTETPKPAELLIVAYSLVDVCVINAVYAQIVFTQTRWQARRRERPAEAGLVIAVRSYIIWNSK